MGYAYFGVHINICCWSDCSSVRWGFFRDSCNREICWWSNSGHRNAVAVYATGAAGYSYCFTCGNYCVLFGNEIGGNKR